jgi:DNA primase
MAISDEIKTRLNIVDMVAHYVPDLKKSGRNFTARCPFHQERTPSFVVFPERQTWHCYGACAAGGDIFSFVMRAEKLDFMGALKLLAAQAGIPVPEWRPANTPRHPLLAVNERALRFFQDALTADKGSLARSYLVQRGVSAQSVEHFGLGYSPSTGDELLHHMQGLGLTLEQLVSAGVAVLGEDGTPRDMFRGRLMFAIRDAEGEVVGFAGRVLDDSNPKYLNTPQTPLFDKGRLLYGLDRAKESLAREGVGVIVEGYMDVIAAHEHGYQNVVASMGTALTQHQVALLKRYARSFVLALDPDTAGQEATLRSLEGSWNVFVRHQASGRWGAQSELYQRSGEVQALRIALLPQGRVRRDPMEWQRVVTGAAPVVEYLFDAIARRVDLTSSQAKAQMADRLFPLIAALDNPYDQDRYFQRLADTLGVSRATLEASVGRPQRRPMTQRQPRPSQAVASPFRQVEGDPLEEYALALLLQHPGLRMRAGELAEEHLRRQENRELLSAIRNAGTMELDNVKAQGPLAEHLARLVQRVLPPADSKQQAMDFEACLRRLEERHLRELKAQEETLLAHGSPDVSVQEEQITSVNQRLKEVFVTGGGLIMTAGEHGQEARKDK